MTDNYRMGMRREMATLPTNYVVHGFWGARPEPLELTAQRVAESFDLLHALGGRIANPWTEKSGRAVDSHDVEHIAAHLAEGVDRDSAGTAIHDAGYTQHYYLGDWSRPQGEKLDLGKFDVRTGGEHATERALAAGVVLAFDGAELAAAADAQAQSLVRGLSKIWQPEFMAFTDNALLALRPKYPRYPSRAYVAWLSDSVSRDLDHVDGATTTRFGGGTLLAIDSRDPADAGAVWDGLVETQRIRAAEPKQNAQPLFSV